MTPRRTVDSPLGRSVGLFCGCWFRRTTNKQRRCGAGNCELVRGSLVVCRSRGEAALLHGIPALDRVDVWDGERLEQLELYSVASVIADKHPAKHLTRDPDFGAQTSKGFNRWGRSYSSGFQSLATPYSEMGAPPPPPHPGRNSLKIPLDVQSRLEAIFRENCGGKPYLTAIEAAAVFMQTGLAKADLSRIWDLADFNRDGHFNMNEFVHAMWLIELQTGGSQSSALPLQPRPSPHSATNPYPPPPSTPNHIAIPPPYLATTYQIPPPPPQTFSVPPPPPCQWQQTSLTAAPCYHEAAHPGYPPLPAPQPEPTKTSKAMICAGCEAGILPDDIIYYCAECDKRHNGLSYCERCYSAGGVSNCKHGGPKRVKLKEDVLPIRDKDGSWLMGVKCINCKTKMKKKDLCFKCNQCWDPDFCPNCWRSKDKRCKHAAKGNVKMCRVGRKDDEIDEIIDGVLSVLGG
ncbi:hypothetical protein Purlil1_12180 [Purpureocillium lilacinum]|uniref:Uncharacterized protein n=1 Tax=Purpureocillium lilacinum TaxID=33203 RepID=A0ABR0BHT8_PURLI|nr:hypothetical protein Purlil1_12180 [Purpureocillium lilacinum]